MSDKIILRLNDRFALGTDDLQWILFSLKHLDLPVDHPTQNKHRAGISFVRSTKAILYRCMREAGCWPVAEAQLALEAYPATFEAWKAAATPDPAEAKRLLEAGKRMEAMMAKRMPPDPEPLAEAAE